MLENLVAWVLNNYIGDYLENLNTDQLSIALLQGQVELENVPFKKTALRKFDVPLQVKSGILGKLTLSVPLTRLRSEPWVIKMSDILLLLEPSTSARYDVETMEVYEHNKKEEQLEELEKHHKKQLLAYFGIEHDEKAVQQGWWGASLVAATLNNIQLILTNVHIRYEDDIALPNRTPFACGIRIHNISMQTTNAQWVVGYMQPADGVNMFKKLEIDGLSVYWNCGQQIVKEIKSHKDLQQLMAPEIGRNNAFILQPFSAQLLMEKNTSKFPLKNHPYIPRFKLNLRPQKVIIELTKRQLSEMSSLSKEWARFDRARQHRKWRPLVTVGENAKEWWHFVYNRVGEEKRHSAMRHTWQFAFNRAKQLNAYCRAYRRKLLASIKDKKPVSYKTSSSNLSNIKTSKTQLNTSSSANSLDGSKSGNDDEEEDEDESESESESNSSTKSPASAALMKSKDSEDFALMKQIERDSGYTYHELHLFREMVFRKLLVENELSRSFDEGTPQSDDESFENIDIPVPREDSKEDVKTPKSNDEQSKIDDVKQTSSVYQWLSGWIYTSKPDEQKVVNENKEEIKLPEMVPADEKDLNLPEDLKKLEKQFEDEILDVLNEGKDDSTVLHRDTLLAEIKIKLERLTIRFLDNYEFECHGTDNSSQKQNAFIFLVCEDNTTRVLAMDLWRVVSCMNLSPRRNTTVLSLTVGDMNLQRLCTYNQNDGITENSTADAVRSNDESPIFGFGGAKEKTQILFAVGKANIQDSTEDSAKKSGQNKDPLFHMIYRRRAPKMIAKHSMTAHFSEISVMYNEGALDDIANLFGESEMKKTDANLEPPKIVITNVLDFSVQFPMLKIELCSKKENLLDRQKSAMNSTPFALAEINNLKITLNTPERFVTKLGIEFGYMQILDLFESKNERLLYTSEPTTREKLLPSPIQGFSPQDSRKETNAVISPDEQARSRDSSTFITSESSSKTQYKDVGITDSSKLNILLIDDDHPSFVTEYNKLNCLLDANITSMNIGMNRRSWSLFFDFFGMFGNEKKVRRKSPTTAAKEKLFAYKCNIKTALVQVFMNYPANNSRLGELQAECVSCTVQTVINDELAPLSILASFVTCTICDRTPFYSALYGERISIQPTNKKELDACAKSQNVGNQRAIQWPKATINITQCMTLKASEHFGWNAKVELRVPSSMSVAYVHTHRFLCSLLDYWQQFFELHDIIKRSCSLRSTMSDDHRKPLISLDLEFDTRCIIALPLNQLCNQAIIGETNKIALNNCFKYAPSVEDFNEVAIGNKFDDDDFSCLIDFMSVFCTEVSFYEAVRVANSATSLPHSSIPDFSMTTVLDDINIKFTIDFYRLLRGFLELNLGDDLVPVPENIPIEVLQRPIDTCEVGSSSKYATFSFRMKLCNVQFNCFVPSDVASQGFNPFGSVIFHSTRISFDSFIDNQSELDFLCESFELVDNRFPSMDSEKCFNVFSSLLCPKVKKELNGGQLMAEAHMMFKKDEPPVITLVLLNSRVLIFLDWFNDAKNFILLTTDFVPPDVDAYRFTNTQMAAAGVLQKTIASSPSSNPPEQTIILKITLKESDLILLEKTESNDSLALILHVDAVLNMNDPRGVLNANLEIQVKNIDWCLMSMEDTTKCQLTNQFAVTISLTADDPQAACYDPKQLIGLSVFSKIKHRLMVELSGLICRISYRDVKVIQNVLNNSIKRLYKSLEKSVFPVRTPHANQKSLEINIIHTIISSHQVSIWMLDDYQGTAFPLVRLVVKKFLMDREATKTLLSFIFAIDYFNQSVFGWEPLLEEWNIKQLTFCKKDNSMSIDLLAGEKSPLNVNITPVLIQQMLKFHSRLPELMTSFDHDFQKACSRSRSDHLPYLLCNDSGSDLRFTTSVDEIMESKIKQRKSSAKWISVSAGATCTFEFPTRRLTILEGTNEMRQLVVRVDGWDDISPVNVDAVGTYFRLAKCSSLIANNMRNSNVRLVIAVTMDRNGRKVVSIRSALTVCNQICDPVLLILSNESNFAPEGTIIRVSPKQTLNIPLKFANAAIRVKPDGLNIIRAIPVDWQVAKRPGEIVNQLIQFETKIRNAHFWLCASVRREHYPEYEMLSGHTISFLPPLTVLNLLPTDVEFKLDNVVHVIAASKQVQLTSVDISNQFSFEVSTDRMISVKRIKITKLLVSQKTTDAHRLHIKMKDSKRRYLDLYCSLNITNGGAVFLTLWVPYWIVNKSGIPLIVKQEAASDIAAGQMDEHERAKDRNPLMFSFADVNCPQLCVLRIGKTFAEEKGCKTVFGSKFPLTVGLHSMKLCLTNEHHASQIYNIGVEVRQGTGRYKDTQVVMLTPRYVLNNHTSFNLSLSHVDHINVPNQQVQMSSQCSLIWNENYEDNRMLCVKRDDVKHWSCPFRIDLISSFHVTMRDADETPKFIRVEILLSSAVFYVTFTDARFYPAPVQLENFSDVPVLYQQKIERSSSSLKLSNHLRSICKPQSTVDYAWDDHHSPKQLILQVYESKSNVYDPHKPGIGPPLVYKNDVYIKYAQSFNRDKTEKYTDHLELALEVMQKGKVMLNKLNVSDSSQNQLWRFTSDGCLENVGMSSRARAGERYVLDVLDRGDFVLMMLKRNSARDRYQKWYYTTEKQIRCKLDGLYVEATKSDVRLASTRTLSKRIVPLEQIWEIQTQRPGSGVLNVECLHRGPTLVVRIMDSKKSCSSASYASRSSCVSFSSPIESTAFSSWMNFELNIVMRSGIGISIINGLHEELLYVRFQGIVLHVNRKKNTCQVTGSVEAVQADNQMLGTDKWQVLFCHQGATSEELSFAETQIVVPAMKLEMNYTPLEHYDAFDCFRLKLCDMSVQLDETLLWKIIQFVQKSEAAERVQPNALLQPPNIELDKIDNVAARRCYFGTLDLEIGAVALSVVTVANSCLPSELRRLKRQFNIKLVSFENAIISLPPFRQLRYFETFSFLMETLSKFYLEEFKNQTFNIIVTMDAFGNPLGLASDLKESFEGLLFEGDLGGFVSGLGYGVTNSISKVASSMAHGVGALTFDERHELMRRRMLRCQPQPDSNTALAHLYCGVKGLGVGVLGGLTAILTNTYTESRKDGLAGAFRGITTGAVDTVTKPVQGLFDLVEGTASAVKEIVGGPSARKSHFPESRVRLPRVTLNLQSLLPCYSDELACAQMELLRIQGFSTNEILLDLELLFDQITGNDRIKQYALICSEQCYIIMQVGNEPSNVVQRISYRQLKQMQAIPSLDQASHLAAVEVLLEVSSSNRQKLPHIWCYRLETAKELCEKVSRAKQLYDHGKRTLAVYEDYENI